MVYHLLLVSDAELILGSPTRLYATKRQYTYRPCAGEEDSHTLESSFIYRLPMDYLQEDTRGVELA